MNEYQTKNEEETHRVAAAFAKSLQGGELIELVGELGAGKTTFVRGVAQALGATAKVKSPTFTVLNEYPVEGHPTIKKIVHLDLYRMNDEKYLEGLALEDYAGPENIIFIEWPDIFGASPFSPNHRIIFTISAVRAGLVPVPTERTIRID